MNDQNTSHTLLKQWKIHQSIQLYFGGHNNNQPASTNVPPAPLSYSSTHPMPFHMALQYFHFLNVMFTFSSYSALSFHSLYSAIQLLCRIEPSQCWGTFVLVQPLITSDTTLQIASCVTCPTYQFQQRQLLSGMIQNMVKCMTKSEALSSSSQHCLQSLQKDTVAISAIIRMVKSAKRTRNEYKHCDP